jgi:hypothetical protein
MNKNFVIAAALILLAVSSCDTPRKDTRQVTPQPLNQMQIMRLKQDAAAVASSGTTTTTAPVQTSSAVVLNPAHGLPGHRCDIPVGSPLPGTPVRTDGGVQNSASAPAASNPARLSSVSESVPVTPGNITPSASTPRLNPPHGEPGHRCEIPVGSPLP